MSGVISFNKRKKLHDPGVLGILQLQQQAFIKIMPCYVLAGGCGGLYWLMHYFGINFTLLFSGIAGHLFLEDMTWIN